MSTTCGTVLNFTNSQRDRTNIYFQMQQSGLYSNLQVVCALKNLVEAAFNCKISLVDLELARQRFSQGQEMGHTWRRRFPGRCAHVISLLQQQLGDFSANEASRTCKPDVLSRRPNSVQHQILA